MNTRSAFRFLAEKASISFLLMASVFISLTTGCQIYTSEHHNYPQGHVFPDVAIPECNLFLRVAHLSSILNSGCPQKRSRVSVDLTLPRITVRCFPDSRDIAASISSDLTVQLIHNLGQTNATAAFPWGNGGIPLYAINGRFIDGETIIKMVGETSAGGILVEHGQITFRLFPPELEIIEYKQKKENGLHGFHWLREFNFYESDGQQELFINHPYDISRIFVIAPPCVHRRALKEMQSWQLNSTLRPSLPDVPPAVGLNNRSD